MGCLRIGKTLSGCKSCSVLPKGLPAGNDPSILNNTIIKGSGFVLRTVRASVKIVCWFALLIQLNSITKLEEALISTISAAVGCRCWVVK